MFLDQEKAGRNLIHQQSVMPCVVSLAQRLKLLDVWELAWLVY